VIKITAVWYVTQCSGILCSIWLHSEISELSQLYKCSCTGKGCQSVYFIEIVGPFHNTKFALLEVFVDTGDIHSILGTQLVVVKQSETECR